MFCILRVEILPASSWVSPEFIKDWLVKPLRDQHVKPKSKATFKGELFKDTPNWKWMKGDTEITPSEKMEITKDGTNVTLTVNNCQPDDVAEYTMEVEDRRYTAKLTLGGPSTEILDACFRHSSADPLVHVLFQNVRPRS